MIEQGWRLVVSHGNGPQVGFILRRSELSEYEVDPVPVDYAVADTQGAIGYMFVKALTNELARRGLARPVVAVVTQSVVDLTDEAFKNPTKPIGSFLNEATARARQTALGWTIMEDAGRGWRRTVPSPRPQRILETETIRTLLDNGAVVVAAGGGGIPGRVQADGTVVGVEAVVDKDLASGLLAHELGADMLLIPTGVPRVAIRFGTPEQRWLDTLTVDEARAYHRRPANSAPAAWSPRSPPSPTSSPARPARSASSGRRKRCAPSSRAAPEPASSAQTCLTGRPHPYTQKRGRDTMKLAGIPVLPEVDPSRAPFWRQVLRGFSQCAFQANELTALFFITAATFFNWRMGAAYVVSVVVATLVAKLLRANAELLGLGLYGFNSGLMGLALTNFFHPGLALWCWVPVLAALVAALTIAMARWLPFPFLAAPFIVTFWILWPLAGVMGLEKIDLGAFPHAPVTFIAATVSALGATLFASGPVVGLIFLAGVLVSNWRHAVVALMGAALAASLAAHVGAPGTAINSGFVGFNAVLAAIATYALISTDLRFAALAALGATWIFSIVSRLGVAPALASGFVLTVWLILLVGWLNPRFNGAELRSTAE